MLSRRMSGTRELGVIETAAARVGLCEDSVVEIRIHEGATVDVPEMEGILAAQTALVETRPTLVLVDSRGVRSMTRAAQERTTKTAPKRDTRAVAIVVGNPVSALLGNFFLKLGIPVYPTRLFRDPDSARAWLHTHSLEAR
jgi:hypothetical protein